MTKAAPRIIENDLSITLSLISIAYIIVSNAYLAPVDGPVNTAYKQIMGNIVKLKRGDLREALIVYALDAAKQGHIEIMSLRAAARDLGVSSGAVYRHFTDKDALLVEIVMIGFEELRERFLTIRPENSRAETIELALERSRAFVTNYIDFALDKPALWHMMFGRVGNLAREILMADAEKCAYTPFDAVLENIRDLYRLGALDHEPDLADVRYLWSATHGAADLAQSGARLDSDQIETVCTQTIDRNLRAIGFSMPKSQSTQG